MTRYFSFLALLISLTLPVAGDTQHARAEVPNLGKITALAPPGTPWEAQWFYLQDRFAERGVTMDFFIRGEIGSEEVMMSRLRRNQLQIGGMSLQGLASVVPELSVAMLPYIFESPEEVDFVYDNYLLEPINALFERRGLRILQWMEVGWTNMYSAGAPILTPADSDGRKLRGSPNVAAQEYLRAVGADAIPVGSTDLIQALETGLIDGGLAATVFIHYQLGDYVDHVTLTRHSYDTGAIIANVRWWERLSEDQRQIIMESFMPSDQARQMVRDLIAEVIVTLEDRGATVHDLSDEQREQWAMAARSAHQRIIDQSGGSAQEIYDIIMEGKAAFQAMKEAEMAQSERDDDAEAVTETTGTP